MASVIKEISIDQLLQLQVSAEHFTLVDVLPKEHFEREHIKGAISLPVTEIESRAKECLRREDTIVVYCASFQCQASTHAAAKLLALGFRNVFDYKGGLEDYKQAGFALEGSDYTHREFSSSCGCA